MSINVTQQPDPVPSTNTDDRVSPVDVFDEVAWSSREICNGCFAKIRSADRVVQAGVHGHDVEEHDPHGALRSYPETVFCSECGSESGTAGATPLSRRRALEVASALIDRVREAGVVVDDRAVRELVRRCKSDEDLQSQDTEIFRRAVALGVRRERRRRR